jgi:hypothetical protein
MAIVTQLVTQFGVRDTGPDAPPNLRQYALTRLSQRYDCFSRGSGTARARPQGGSGLSDAGTGAGRQDYGFRLPSRARQEHTETTRPALRRKENRPLPAVMSPLFSRDKSTQEGKQ